MSPYTCEGIPVLSANEKPKEGQGMYSSAAEIYCFWNFKIWFESKFHGIAFRDLEYRLLSDKSDRALQRVLNTLPFDFRANSKERDWRKPDALGIAARAAHGQLFEVTTEKRFRHGAKDTSHALAQLDAKLELLQSMNRQHNFTTQWHKSPWRPSPEDVVPLQAPNAVRWICYRPTFRMPTVPAGIILYEVHELSRKVLYPPPFLVPHALRQRLREIIRNAPEPSPQALVPWGKKALELNPDVAAQLVKLLAVVGFCVLIAGLIAPPLALAGLAAMALALATRQLAEQPPAPIIL